MTGAWFGVVSLLEGETGVSFSIIGTKEDDELSSWQSKESKSNKLFLSTFEKEFWDVRYEKHKGKMFAWWEDKIVEVDGT